MSYRLGQPGPGQGAAFFGQSDRGVVSDRQIGHEDVCFADSPTARSPFIRLHYYSHTGCKAAEGADVFRGWGVTWVF